MYSVKTKTATSFVPRADAAYSLAAKLLALGWGVTIKRVAK